MNKKEKLKEIIKNSEYKFLGITKILDYPYLKFQCLECNHIFIVDIPTLLENEEIYCSECYDDVYSKIKNKYEWIRYFYDINGEKLTPLEWIENSRSVIKTKCNKCGHVWNRRARSVRGCPKCKGLNKRLSAEEIVKKVKEISPKIKILSDLRDNKNDEPLYRKRINVKCLECGHEYSVLVSNLLSGTQCPNCCRKIKPEEFNKTVKKLYPNIEILTDINGLNEYITYKCLKCNREYTVKSSVLYYGNLKIYCKNCCDKERQENNDKKYKELIKEYHKDNIYTDDFIGDSDDYAEFHCRVCGNTWNTRARSVANGMGCPKCYAISKMLNNEEFEKRFYELHPRDKYTILSKYNGMDSIVKVKCLYCGTVNERKAYEYLKRSNACTNKCEDINYWNVEHKKELDKIYGKDFNIIYQNPNNIKSHEYITIKCKNCGREYVDGKHNLLKYERVCTCKRLGSSIKENNLYQFIKNTYDGSVIKNFRTRNGYGKIYELDIYLPDLKLGFEFDGLYWHSEEIAGKDKQVDKLMFFKESGVRVIFIREDEWDNKENIVKSRIKNIMNAINEKYYARQCNVVEITKSQSDLFLNKYHIQGKDSNSIRIGLIQGNKLLSVMTFGKTRNSMRSKLDKNENTYELLRFASRANINVVGGFSKLFKYFIKMYNPRAVKTFADRRWSVGNVYEKNGFILDHISEPGYVYFKQGKVFHRVQFQKHKLERLLENYDPNLSEYQNMLNNKYHRYWDCGQLVYYYVNSEYKGDK